MGFLCSVLVRMSHGSFKMASKRRVTSAVVASEYFQKQHQRRERERRRRSSESDENEYYKHRSLRDRLHRDDRRDRRSDMGSRRKSENEDDGDRNKNKRGLQSEKMEKVSVFDRLSSGNSRNQQGREREVIEVETDPSDVPRGNRYFEHDDRGTDRGRGYMFNRQNNRNSRMTLQRQRSRSPVWRHDRFEDRRERVSDDRRRNRRSPVWKHDKFEEQEIMENKKDTKYKEET